METLLTESLWGDEGFSAMAVQRPFFEMIGVVMRDTAPPLFYIVGYIWGRLFGFSEVALRSLSLILIIGASAFAGLIVYRINKDKATGIAAGLLAFFSPFLFPFAFEWRMYALFAFTVMGSIYFFINREWKGYVLFTVAALYTHHYALFTVLGQALLYLVEVFERRNLIKTLKNFTPFFLVGALYLPWLYPFYLQLTRVKGAGFWLSAPSFEELAKFFYRFATGGVKESLRVWAALLVLVMLAGKEWKKAGRKWVELLIVFMAPVAIAFVVSHLFTPIFFDRYLFSVIIGMAVLFVIGIKKWAWPALVVLMVIYFMSSTALFTHPTKKPFRELAGYVKSVREPGDYLINYNGKAHHLWETQYYGIPAPIYTPEGPLPLYVGTAQMEEKDTIEELPDVSRIGVVTSDPVENVKLPDSWKVSEKAEFGELKVLWFERGS